ncbi:hypothetical protein ADK59_21545 [Streptomyces sp. XY332]|nr:hypothetical protein ADK59_21545 [Streptomyces sp. XY332]
MALTTMPSTPEMSVHDSSHCCALIRSVVIGHTVQGVASRCPANRASSLRSRNTALSWRPPPFSR